MKNKQNKIFNNKALIIVVAIIAVSVFANGLILYKKGFFSRFSNIGQVVEIKSVSAHELYDMFSCPCCGRPIDTNCCASAKERIKFAQNLAADGLSKDKAVLAYVKKFGINSFISKEKAEDFRQLLKDNAPANRPKIKIVEPYYDFSDISLAGGVVSYDFVLKNEGNRDLVINKLETSCGCTSASVVYAGVEGPTYSMPGHGQDGPKNWRLTIPAGDEAVLRVYYNPAVHPDFRGLAVREIYIYSDDPINFQATATIELNQTD